MKNGMKQTEIGEIPAEWEVRTFDKFFQVVSGRKNQLTSLEYQTEGPYPIIDQGQKSVVGYTDRLDKVFENKSGIIIFGDHTRLVKFVDFDFVVGADGTQLLSNKDGVLLKFAYYQLSSREITNLGYSRHFKLVKEMLFVLPPLPEQRKIAEILSTLDEKMAVIDEQLAQTHELKKGLMQRLLTKGIGHTQFKDSPLGEIPVSWEAKEVQHVLTVHNTCRKPLSAEVRKLMKGTYRYYGPTGILDHINEFMLDGKYALIGEDGDHFLKYKTKKMTLLVEGKFNVNNHAHILSGGDECLTTWFHLFYQHRDLDTYLTRQGAGRYKLTKAALLRLPIALPPIHEQGVIVELFDCIDDKIGVLQDKKAQYQTLKKGLMQQLLTGQRRVRVATGPVAELV